MKELIKDWSPVVALVAIFLLLLELRGCEPKPIEPKIDIKPELKAQDSLKHKVDSLDRVSKIALNKALKSDSVANHYLDRYRFYKAKFLSKQDSTPCGTEIKFITQSCDSLIAQDSLRNLAWKELHKNDSTEIAGYKNLRGTDSIIQNKLITKLDSVCTVNKHLDKKVKRTRTIAKVAFGVGLLGGGYLGIRLR